MSASAGSAKIIFTGPSPRGWHRLQLAAECLQKYAWRYEAPGATGKLDPSPALAKGTLIHLALAQHYARMRAGLRPDQQDLQELSGIQDREEDWCAPEEAVDLISQLEGIEKYAQASVDTYRAYAQHYHDDHHKWKVVAVEELMSGHIAGKYLLTGRADLVVEDMAGRIFVIDHKTTARLTSRHKEFYAVSGQLLGYSHLARLRWGERFSGFIVNLIQHGDNPKFERITLPRSPNMEARFEQTVVDIEESIERMQASGRDYDNWPKAMNEMTCYGRYGACDFINQCRWGVGAKKAGNWTWSDQ